MNVTLVEKRAENINSIILNAALKEVTTVGIVNFNPINESNGQANWNGKKLIVPVYGVYKISWGFSQSSLHTFYKDAKVELGLIVNNKMQDEKAEITKETKSFHAVKSSHKTCSLLFRENETLSLHAEILNADTLNIKDIYLKVEKLAIDENNKFGYEN